MAAPAQAQGLLPAYGTDVRVGDLRQQFSRMNDAGPKTLSERAWTFSPAIAITETYDSAIQLPGGRGRDYTTRITPTFAGTVDTQRLKGELNYSPTYNLYALHGSESGLSHNLNANATGTLVPDLLFANLTGYAATQPLLGTAAPSNAPSGRVNEVQTAHFSGGPYIQKRLSDFAIVSAGYTISRTTMTSLAPRATAATVPGVNSNFSSQQENASIATGPDFGRINASLAAMATQYEGAGVYRGAHNETVTASTAYAITRAVTATGSIGHETIVYGPGGPKAIDGITWSGGFMLTPNADSTLNLKYGHQQGASSFSFDGNYALTSRLRLLARYSQGVGTNLQNLQSALAGTTTGPAGIAVDRTTGAPVQLGNSIGQQPGVYRTTIASVSAAYQIDRDVISLDWSSSEQVLLSGSGASSASSSAAAGFGSNTSTTMSAAWQHNLSEALNSSLSLQYGTRSYPGARGESETATISLAVNYVVSETISTNALVSHAQTKGKTVGLAPVRDYALVGVRKAF